MDRTLSALPRRRARKALFETLLDLAGLIRTRRRLAVLDDHLLRDIGIDRETAQAEAARPVWDVPDFWRR